ncbi:MAG: transposase [Burkholderiales bacterium]
MGTFYLSSMTIYYCVLLPLLWLCGTWRRLQSKTIRKIFRRHARQFPAKRFRPAPPRRSGGWPKPPWVVEEVLRLFAEGRSYGKTSDEFNRLYAHAGMTVGKSTVHEWVQKHRPEAEAVRRATRNRFPSFASANLRWCLDGTGKQDAAGAEHFILGILDHGTRLNRVLSRLASANAQAILEQIALAVGEFGKPRIIRTDNEPIFHSPAFEEGLAALGIRHEFTEPGKPWQNGRIERFFLTLKEKLNRITPEDGATLDSLLSEFSCWYNAVRPHQHLYGLTPQEAWSGVDPYKTAPKAVLRFDGWDGMLRGYYLQR